MLQGHTRETFERALQRSLSPSTPIRNADYLRGREKNLEQVRRAFVQPGRQVFIYGDRGVGKTSLALTAALEHDRSYHEPLILNCRGAFFAIMRDLINRLAEKGLFLTKDAKAVDFSLAGVLGLKRGTTKEEGRAPELKTLNEVVEGLKQVCRIGRADHVVVFDEFELVDTADDRKLFGDLIKALSDQQVPLKAIFCGIGESVAGLLDNHPSAPRYLSSVELSRLSYSARLEIMDGVQAAFGIEIEHNTRYRIALISDGFPHYIHLICEKLLWSILDDPLIIGQSTVAHYKLAVAGAVEDAQPYLKSLYEKAVKKYERDYAQVLWAAADHQDLERRSKDIFETYIELVESAHLGAAMDRARFNQRLNALKSPSHGQVLEGTRQGWYKFRESMLRGFVRLMAEEAGVMLTVDHPLAPKASR
ncbi:AAA family ATPase [Roseomonas sp. WA12]